MKRWTAVVMVAALAGCVVPQAALDTSAEWKGRIVQQLETVADEDAEDFAAIATADAEEVWAQEAEKYWVRAHRPGETTETLALFVAQSAEATRRNLETNERRRALRVQKIRNSALAVEKLDEMRRNEANAREAWLKLLLKGESGAGG